MVKTYTNINQERTENQNGKFGKKWKDSLKIDNKMMDVK